MNGIYVLMVEDPPPDLTTPVLETLRDTATKHGLEYPWWPVLLTEDRDTCDRFSDDHPGLVYRVVTLPESLIEDNKTNLIGYLIERALLQQN